MTLSTYRTAHGCMQETYCPMRSSTSPAPGRLGCVINIQHVLGDTGKKNDLGCTYPWVQEEKMFHMCSLLDNMNEIWGQGKRIGVTSELSYWRIETALLESFFFFQTVSFIPFFFSPHENSPCRLLLLSISALTPSVIHLQVDFSPQLVPYVKEVHYVKTEECSGCGSQSVKDRGLWTIIRN